MITLEKIIIALAVVIVLSIIIKGMRNLKSYEYKINFKFMSNRKYVNANETPQAYECTKKKCSWQGEHQEKHKRYSSDGWATSVCPNCGNDEFYGLVEKPKKPANTKLKGSY